MISLDDELRAWAEATVGPVTVAGEKSHSHGESRVWKLRSERDQTDYYLKSHRQAGKWRGEVNAYRAGWAASLGPNLAPRLLAYRDGDNERPRAVLLSALRGEVMEKVPVAAGAERAAWRKAGAALRRLHDGAANTWFGGCDESGASESATPETAPVRFVAGGMDAYIARCKRVGGLDSDAINWARETLPGWADSLTDETPVPCHRDYTPRNWLADPQSGAWTGVIDFEHARWDVRARDLARSFDHEFVARPDLKSAFFEGYDSDPPDTRLLRQIKALRLIGALATYGWAVEHNDAAFAEQNKNALLRLRLEERDERE